jgi:hypothetical protein
MLCSDVPPWRTIVFAGGQSSVLAVSETDADALVPLESPGAPLLGEIGAPDGAAELSQLGVPAFFAGDFLGDEAFGLEVFLAFVEADAGGCVAGGGLGVLGDCA